MLGRGAPEVEPGDPWNDRGYLQDELRRDVQRRRSPNLQGTAVPRPPAAHRRRGRTAAVVFAVAVGLLLLFNVAAIVGYFVVR